MRVRQLRRHRLCWVRLGGGAAGGGGARGAAGVTQLRMPRPLMRRSLPAFNLCEPCCLTQLGFQPTKDTDKTVTPAYTGKSRCRSHTDSSSANKKTNETVLFLEQRLR